MGLGKLGAIIWLLYFSKKKPYETIIFTDLFILHVHIALRKDRILTLKTDRTSSRSRFQFSDVRDKA
jgi:hypothetical protein